MKGSIDVNWLATSRQYAERSRGILVKLLMSIAAALGTAGMVWSADAGLMERIRGLEAAGEARQARQLLDQALRSTPANVEVLEVAAHFEDVHRSPLARSLYQRLLDAPELADARRQGVLRRLVELDLAVGDRVAANTHAAGLRLAGGTIHEIAQASQPVFPMGSIEIPGPIRGFARMAALAPDAPPDELLLALARNIVTNGYQAVSGAESLDQTEYLKLVMRYLAQARELDKFSGESKTIQIENCESENTGELLKILGFRLRGACGGDVALETVNASRAFLAMDSGFPLARLEQSLRTNRPFSHDFKPTRVPVIFSSDYWLSVKEKSAGEFIDAFLNDPSMCRLYLGLAKLDPETAEDVRKSMPLRRIRAFAHVFDFFGGMFRVRNGMATVPGGDRSAGAWSELAGVSPEKGVAFLEKIVTKDDGWLASYFDSLSRLSGPSLDYLTEPARLKRFYAAMRGKVTSPGPARPVFRANTDLMLLTTRLDVVDGQVRIPGDLALWKAYFTEHSVSKIDARLSKSAAGWNSPDDLIEALFGLSRKSVENEPLKVFLALSDFNRRRSKPLEPATVGQLIHDFKIYGAQAAILTEAPELSDAAILHYFDAAHAIDTIKDNTLRANAAGVFQSLAAYWQILYRNHEMAPGKAEAALESVNSLFLKPKSSSSETFDSGRAGLTALLSACGVEAGANPQEKLLALLGGSLTPSDADTHTVMVTELNRVFEAQKLVSLKTLFDLDDQLDRLAKGEKPDVVTLNRLAARVSDLNLPKPTLSTAERVSSAFGYWVDHHVEAERKLNFRPLLDKAQGSADKMHDLRGLLTPLMRDSMVGLVYAYYAPPGAQILYTNPMFVRSHDFIGLQTSVQTWRTTEVVGAGWPSNAGGRLVGSLAGLPYALAEAEQNFLIPSREQALIWGDLVPQMLVGSKSERWWNVTPSQVRWVALHTRLGEAVITEAALDPAGRTRAIALLERYAPPARARRVEAALAGGDVAMALEQVTPSELYLAGLQASVEHLDPTGFLDAEIRRLVVAEPKLCNEQAISEAFGTPKPTLTHSYVPQLLNLRTFPTLMGYSSRILAESWESNNLFFASLADELMIPPAQLNLLIPEWTKRSVEQIFATHLEDWPALLRAMRATAEEARAQSRKMMAMENRPGLEY
jgi:hypothetical protein